MESKKVNEYVYGLSQMSHIHKNMPTQPPRMGPEESKHLRILDAVALFLVTEAKGDVAAVTFKQATHTIEIFYAKNSPCDDFLTIYANKILAYIFEFRHHPLEEVVVEVCLRAVKQCLKKVRARLLKLFKNFRDVLGDDLNNGEHVVQCLFPTVELSPEMASRLVRLVQKLQSLAATDLETLRGKIVELAFSSVISFEVGMFTHDPSHGLWDR